MLCIPMVSISHMNKFSLIFEHINNNDQQSSNISKYSLHIRKGGYQPHGGDGGKKWDNESEDKVLLI